MRQVLIIFVLSAFGACSNAPSKKQCEQLFENVINLQIQSAGANTPEMKAELEKQKKQLDEKMRDEFMKDCLDQLPKAQVECGIQVKSMSELAKCDE